MTEKRTAYRNDPEQSCQFIEKAKEIGTSEDPKVFERALEQVIGGKPGQSSKQSSN